MVGFLAVGGWCGVSGEVWSPYEEIIEPLDQFYGNMARRAVYGGHLRRWCRWWWSYRVELTAFWAVYWFCVTVGTVLGSHLGGWVLDALAVAAVALPPVRRRIRGLLTRSRLRRRFARAVRLTGSKDPKGRVPRPGRIRSIPAGHVVAVRLTHGWHAGELEQRRAPIAAYLKVREVRVLPDRANAGRCEVVVVRRDPLSGGTPLSWPWMDVPRTSLWDAIPVGLGEDGVAVELVMGERNIVVGGEPGGGKSVAVSMLVAAAALDPHAHLTLFDGKLVELAIWRGCADRFVGPRLEEATEALGELRADMDERYAYLHAEGRRKITQADQGRFPLRLVVVDELALYTASPDRKASAEFSGLLRDLVARGRAAGIVVVAATQKPSSDIVPTALRDLFGFRWAMRCSTPQASDTILGSGWASAGFSASSIDSKDRGVGFLLAEGAQPVRLKSYYLSDDDLVVLARRAEELRRRHVEDASRVEQAALTTEADRG